MVLPLEDDKSDAKERFIVMLEQMVHVSAQLGHWGCMVHGGARLRHWGRMVHVGAWLGHASRWST